MSTKVDIEEMKLLTPEFRASHPHVFKPTEVKKGDGKPQYSIEMLFDKKTTKLSEFTKRIKAAARNKWGDDESEWPKPLILPIRDGDKPHGKKKEIKPEHKGMWVIRSSSSAQYSKPHVVGKNPKEPLENEAQFYPGCYARAQIKAHAYSFADKDGVKFILDGVQFIRDGKAIGGKKPADQMFGVIEGDDGDIGETEDDSFALGGGDDAEGEDSYM